MEGGVSERVRVRVKVRVYFFVRIDKEEWNRKCTDVLCREIIEHHIPGMHWGYMCRYKSLVQYYNNANDVLRRYVCMMHSTAKPTIRLGSLKKKKDRHDYYGTYFYGCLFVLRNESSDDAFILREGIYSEFKKKQVLTYLFYIPL
jgi:hypothetical protein